MHIKDSLALGNRPLVTFALLAYNQQEYITEAVKGALSQTYNPLEIILSDDCSTDNTFEIMVEMTKAYKGNHIIKLNKNKYNKGTTDHLNTIFDIARGELIVVAAGDDISLSHRTSRLVKAWVDSGMPDGLIHSGCEILSGEKREIQPSFPNSKIDSSIIYAYARNPHALIHGATPAYTKSLIKKFGNLPSGAYIEDLILTFRALLVGNLIPVNEALVKYRVHNNSVNTRPLLNDKKKWNRWISSMIKVLECHQQDLTKHPHNLDANLILKRLDNTISLYRKSMHLINGNRLQKILFLFQYPGVGGFVNRTGFIFQLLKMKNSPVYKGGMVIRKIYKKTHSLPKVQSRH